MERIQKRIASCGVASRRKAEELIKEGRVKVNGVVVETLGYKLNPNDEVTVDDVVIAKVQKQYYVLNKPRAVISSVEDEHSRKTVLDFCSKEMLKEEEIDTTNIISDTGYRFSSIVNDFVTDKAIKIFKTIGKLFS